MIFHQPSLKIKKTPVRIAIVLGLLAILALNGCGTSVSSTVLTPSPTSLPPSPQISTAAPTLATATLLPRPTQTSTQTPTQTPTQIPSPTSTQTATQTPTKTPTLTPTKTPTLTPTQTPTLTPTQTPTLTPTQTATTILTSTLPSSVAYTPVSTDTALLIERLKSTECLCDAACPCNIEYVVIISIDGLRPDALAQADTPILDALQTAGAYSPSAQAVVPSVTLINHASMLSGMIPEKHGVHWNVYNPDLGVINGPTLFSLLHEAGQSTAMLVGKPRLEHLVLPGSVDIYDYAGSTDSQVVDHALEVIKTGLPDLLFIHLPDVDSAGHAGGWMSQIQFIALSQTDHLIGQLVAALEAGNYLNQTLLIVTTDHGGSGIDHGSDSPEDVTIPWLAVGPGVPAGLSLKNDIMIYDTAATALYAFHLPVPEVWDGQPVLEIFGQLSPEQ